MSTVDTKAWREKIRILALLRVGIKEIKCECGKDLPKQVRSKHFIRWQKPIKACECGRDILHELKKKLIKLKCKRCGLSDIKLLQINHKNLDGGKEKKGHYLYRKIAHGERKVDDLELTCAVCNWLHYAEKKFNMNWVIQLDPRFLYKNRESINRPIFARFVNTRKTKNN